MASKRLQKRRTKLHEMDPKCYWCQKPTVLPETLTPEQRKHYPHNAATIDHVRSKYSLSRSQIPDNTERTVLSCFQCNQKRSLETQQLLSNNEKIITSKTGKKQTMHKTIVIHGIPTKNKDAFLKEALEKGVLPLIGEEDGNYVATQYQIFPVHETKARVVIGYKESSEVIPLPDVKQGMRELIKETEKERDQQSKKQENA